MRRALKRAVAIVGTAAVALSGVALTSAPALADGANGEVRGFLWPGDNGNPNWEGTYRMPDGSEAWCASVWQPEPIHATGWNAPERLTYNDGSYFEDSKMERLAYIVSEASYSVFNQTGRTADTMAAATSVIVHDWTFKAPIPANGNEPYQAAWALSSFAAGHDPAGTGQNPTGVPAAYDQLIADADLYYGEWQIGLDAGDTSAALVGDTISVSGELTARGTVPVPGKEISLDITGATGPQTVTTGSDGAFSFDVTVTGQQVSVTASRVAPADVVQMRVPTGWTSATKPQNMIVTSDNEVSEQLEFDASIVSIGTSATDQSDGDKSLAWNGGTIVDVVAYENVVPGNEYTVTGELMDQATGEGTGIFGEATFVAEAASGTVNVEFVVPEGYAGKTLVVFERLFDAEGVLQAVHEDLEDEAQTVGVEEQPTLATTATDQSDGDKTLAWDGGTIVDQVRYTGLIIGKEYVVKGELMNKETKKGTGIFGTTTFVAKSAEGSVEVVFEVPKGHAGATLVVFERLYDTHGVLQAVHEDINDKQQTVTVESKPGTVLASTGDDSMLPLVGGAAALIVLGLGAVLIARRRMVK